MRDGKISSFTDLLAWKEGHQLVVTVYTVTKNFHKEEMYSIIDQMRRAASSVTANIAEGFGRQTYREKVQFFYQSQGSLVELKNFILIAKDVGYLTEENSRQLVEQSNMTHKLLQGLITKSKTFLNLSS